MSKPIADAPLLHTADIWEAIGRAIPDAVAISCGTEQRSWRQFEDNAARLASALTAAGLGPGSPVGLFMQNSIGYLEAYFAGLKIRAIPFGINFRYAPSELAYVLDDADAEALFFDSGLGDCVAAASQAAGLKLAVAWTEKGGEVAHGVDYRALLERYAPMPPIARDPHDPIMTFTGGTTGKPKGVRSMVGRHARGLIGITGGTLGVKVPMSVEDAARNAANLHAAGASPVMIVIPPFMHATGMAYGALAPLIAGGTTVIPEERRFVAANVLRRAEQSRANAMVFAGEVIGRPMAEEAARAATAGRPYDLSRIRAVFSGGMMWTAESKAAFLDYAPNATLVDVAGSTEGHVGTSYATLGHVPDTGVFQPVPTTKVFTPEGCEVRPGSGEGGLLGCVAVSRNPGYHKDAERTAKTFREIDGVSYAIAGDWATVEADGSIRLLGRDSGCINTGGEKVFAEEVESEIMKMPEVDDCVVIGLPDAQWGETVAALVAPRPGATLDAREVTEWVRTRLASYKAPKRVAFTEDFPRAVNGKVNKAAALAAFQAAAAVQQ